tara:strand:+ start:13772 stop:13954 length:183 start_codon:yes stop_codon:yes gene_type:complete
VAALGVVGVEGISLVEGGHSTPTIVTDTMICVNALGDRVVAPHPPVVKEIPERNDEMSES